MLMLPSMWSVDVLLDDAWMPRIRLGALLNLMAVVPRASAVHLRYAEHYDVQLNQRLGTYVATTD